MISAIRYLLSLSGLTIYHGVRMVWYGRCGRLLQGEHPADRIPREYVLGLLRANRIPVEVRGLERIRELQSCVYVANHQSWTDILATVAVLPGSLHFLAKQELGWIPIFGAALRAAGHVEIDRHNLPRALGSYERALAALRAGRRPVLFAEGTRSRSGCLLPFKKGPFVLAITAQVPLVPVFLEGSFDVLPKGSLIVRPRTIVVHLGGPISTAGLAYEDRDRLRDRCREAIVALGARE